jgi:DNA-binding SARP family transcriptional activator
LSLLKGFELRVDDHVADIALAQQRLLAYLALHERSLNRSYLAEMLWPDRATGRANGSLRTALWRLQEVGHLMVETVGQQVRLSPAVRVDAREIASLSRRLGTGETSVSDVDAPLADALIDAGDLLPDWFDDWVIPERERIRHLRLRLRQPCHEPDRSSRAQDDLQLLAIRHDDHRSQRQRDGPELHGGPTHVSHDGFR